MTHDDARDRLSALIDGALSPGEAAELEAHLRGCPECRADLAALRGTVTMLREVEGVQAPEGFAAAVRGRLEGMAQARRPAWERLRAIVPPVGWSWKTAAAVTAIVLAGIFATNLVREVMPGRVGLEDEGQFAQPKGRRQDFRTANRPATVAPEQAGRDAVTSSAQPSTGEPGPWRRVIRTGHVVLEVEAFDAASRRLLAIAEGAGGFIADSSYSDEGGWKRGTFVLRIPASRFGDVVRQVEGLGTVETRQVTGQDVTEEFIDLEARVRNLERHEARLLAFMDRATKIADLMAIENEVARVRGEIERLTGRLRFLGNKVEMATVQADVHEKSRKAPGGFWDLDRTIARIQAAFLSTVRQILGAIEGIAAFTAALLPVAVLVWVAWAILRRSVRRADRPV